MLNPVNHARKKARRTKNRCCLKCQVEFMSEGPGNRICGKCQKKNLKFRDKTAHKVSPPDHDTLQYE